MDPFDQQLLGRLQHFTHQGRRRQLVEVTAHRGCRINVAGSDYLNLSSNDYLGLATNRQFVEEFYAQLSLAASGERFAPGSGASRLMTGNSLLYSEVEQALAQLYAREAAVVFNSGYHLNIGLLPALTTKNDLILADKLCHASLIDGMRLSRTTVARYQHNDYAHLAELLGKKRHAHDNVFIVTESIFSMDGDRADLQRLVALKKAHDAVLVVDEAHAVGVLGPQGLGLAEEQAVLGEIDFLLGTCGKALGGQGAFVVCSRIGADYLLNTARSLIFTTGLPPVALNWLAHVIKRWPALTTERRALQELAAKLRHELRTHGLTTGGDSQIVPVIIGPSATAVRVAELLRQQGYWITAVRPPTVAEGTARLRLSVSAAIAWSEVAPLAGLIATALATSC